MTDRRSDDWWQAAPLATPSPAPARPRVPGVIVGPPVVKQPPAQTPTQAALDTEQLRSARLRNKKLEDDAALESGAPIDIPGDTTAGGDDYLKTIPTNMQTQVKAISEGRLAIPTGAALRSPYWQRMLQMTAQYDPSFDAANAATRRKTRLEFTSGLAARNITSFNTALGHLETLSKAADALNNGSFPAWNTVRNWSAQATGYPEVTSFNTAKQAVVSELERAFRGSAGSVSGIREWESALNSAQSPEQLHAAIRQMVDLLGSRITAMGEQYDAGMGRSSDPINLLDAHAQQVMKSLGSGWGQSSDPSKLAPDEQVLFTGDAAPITGFRFSPEQQGEFVQALRQGDVGQAIALAEKYSGGKVSYDRGELEKAADYFRKNPNGNIDQDYSHLDNAAQDAYDKERYGDNLRPEMERFKQHPVAGALGTFVTKAGQTASAGLLDELTAGAKTILGGGSYSDNLKLTRARLEAESRVNPGTAFAGEMAGGFALPFGGGKSAAQIARLSALYGGTYAAGNADPNPDAPLGQQLAERASAIPAGAAVGYAGARLGSAIADRVGQVGRTPPGGGGRPPPGGSDAVDIARAGADEGVTLSRPIVDPSRRDLMAYLESSPGGGNAVRKPLAKTAEDIEGRVAALGQGGTAQESGMFGETAQKALQQDLKATRTGLGRQYERARQMAKGNTVEGKEAVDRLDAHIADLSNNPNTNKGVIAYLKSIRKDFVDDAGNLLPKDIGAIRDMRTNLSGEINRRALTQSSAERIMSDVLDGARADIRRDLGKSVPAAEKLFRETDVRWAMAKRDEKQIVERIVGPANNPISGGEAMARIRSMAKSDTPRLKRMWEKLDPQTQIDGAASIAQTLGRNGPDEAFSPALFMRSTRNIPEASREIIFGMSGAKSVENLRLLSKAYQETYQRLNHTRSGVVANWARFLGSVTKHGPATGGGLGYLAGGPAGAVTGAIAGGATSGASALGHYLTARVVMSPDMSRWLAQAPRMLSPNAVRAHVAKLTLVASRDPAIAQDALGLQQYLRHALNASPGRAAASDDEHH